MQKIPLTLAISGVLALTGGMCLWYAHAAHTHRYPAAQYEMHNGRKSYVLRTVSVTMRRTSLTAADRIRLAIKGITVTQIGSGRVRYDLPSGTTSDDIPTVHRATLAARRFMHRSVSTH